MNKLLDIQLVPDWEGFISCIARKQEPSRVHFIELFLDPEVEDVLCEKFGLLDGLDPSDRLFRIKKQVRLQSFLGYDYVRCGVDPYQMPLYYESTTDTAAVPRNGGRHFVNEQKGPITTWEEFEQYPWPDPRSLTTEMLEWYEENLPDSMCIVGSMLGHYAEYLTWLMGYTTFCIALYEQPDLIQAIFDRIHELFKTSLHLMLQFSKVKAIWASDDMGFRGGLLIPPEPMRKWVLAGHRELAQITHDHGLPYLLHSCGNLSLIMDDLLDYVQIDAKHSFEDTIEQVTEVKHTYGKRISLLGGIDVNFLCTADQESVRARVRQTLEICMPGGGYCLGTGNSVTNYIPIDNYLAMLDEGRRYSV